MGTTQSLCVIYTSPHSYPGAYLVREFSIGAADEPAPSPSYAVCATLEQARAQVPRHYVNAGRYADDDAAIVEVWTERVASSDETFQTPPRHSSARRARSLLRLV